MTTHPQNPQPHRQTLNVAIALVLGIVVGELLNLTLGTSGMDKPNPVLSQIIEIFIAQQGIGILLSYGKFIGTFYFGLLLICSALSCIGLLFLGRRVWSLLRHIREPMLLAFGTASSESGESLSQIITAIGTFWL